MNIIDALNMENISRRSFLKLSGTSLLALFGMPLLAKTRPFPAESDQDAPTLGRVLNNNATMYDSPSLNGKFIRKHHFDLVLPITGITIGDEQPAYNRIWYEINGEGFVHSGSVQPVEVRRNTPAQSIPKGGQLAEVTVPFTDALWSIRQKSRAAYRMYYSTTHWVEAVAKSEDGQDWYKIYDDKWGYRYYVDATHLRLLADSDLAPLSPDIPPDEKRLEIRLKEQIIVAYEGSRPVFMARTATGAKFRDGDFRTRPGIFETSRKRASRHMAAGEPGIGTGFDLPGVPWVCYLTKSGVAIHGTYWHNDFGSPRSHGCINLPSAAARWIFRWTLPVVPPRRALLEEDYGTQVNILPA